MRKDERDAVRQMLEAVLRNLTGDAPEGQPDSPSVQLFADGSTASDIGSYEAPVILVVSGDLKARVQNTASPRSADLGGADEPEKPKFGVADHSERKLSHPGLERFTLGDAGATSHAPKACFMEPGRACVNSGACEILGF